MCIDRYLPSKGRNRAIAPYGLLAQLTPLRTPHPPPGPRSPLRHPQQLAIDVLVVLAVARGAAVDAAARESGALAELDRHLGDRPAADLGAGHLGQPFEVGQLRIVIAAILRKHVGRVSGALTRHLDTSEVADYALRTIRRRQVLGCGIHPN
jgi:hypothetical protein